MEKINQILSFQECEQVVVRHFDDENAKLVNFRVLPLSDGVEGFLGEHYIVHAKVERSDQICSVSFFAKIPPFRYDLQMEYTRSSRAFEKEIFFYETLCKQFKLYCPTFNENIIPNLYFAKGNDIVVMENLQEKQYTVNPTPDIMDITHIKLILKTLTKFHSASIIYEEKKSEELGRPFRMIEVYADYLEEAFFRNNEKYLGYKWHIASRKGITGIIDKMPERGVSKEEFSEKFNNLTEKCFEIVKPSNIFRNVCCHGDLWQKNILFKYENGIPSECKLIDFQLMKYSPPAFDVLKIIFQSTTAEMRKHHFEDLLNYYYDNLCKELALGYVNASQIISRDQFQASIKYMLPQCKVETSYYYSYQKPGPAYLKQLMDDPEAFKKYSFVDRTPFMLNEYTEGSMFKHWMDEILLDIKDMVTNNGLTREDCNTILRSKLNTSEYNLLSYKVEPVEEKAGFLGDHVKIRMEVNYKEETLMFSFFAKSLPESALNSFAISSGAFDNERFMFDQVFQKMLLFGINDIYKCIPKCYFSRSNDTLVFEDLNKLGFKAIYKHKALDFDQVCIVLKALAQLHSSVLILEEKLTKHNGSLFRVGNQYNKDLLEVSYNKTEGHLGLAIVEAAIKGIYAIIDLFPDPQSTITDKQFKQTVKELYEKTIYNLVGPSKKYRNVICHGDLWASNIMIKYENEKPTDCRLVDFQCVRLCPPAHDVLAFIYLTTSRKFRANFMSELLHLYHSELEMCLAKYNINADVVLPLNEFLLSCDDYKVFAIAQATTHFPITMITSNDMEDFYTDTELCHKTMFVDRTDFINKMCKKNESYKFILEECIKDLRLLCENINE